MINIGSSNMISGIMLFSQPLTTPKFGRVIMGSRRKDMAHWMPVKRPNSAIMGRFDHTLGSAEGRVPKEYRSVETSTAS